MTQIRGSNSGLNKVDSKLAWELNSEGFCPRRAGTDQPKVGSEHCRTKATSEQIKNVADYLGYSGGRSKMFGSPPVDRDRRNIQPGDRASVTHEGHVSLSTRQH
ncbi:hypothetical protein TNCV_2600821 [Trichonephila clavipes]|nr:hypothetical protein TNCV_2600821 [Trichonephila clavipes]